MSFDLVIWKRSPRTKTAMLAECYERILEGEDHMAMDPFDEESLFADLEAEFGERQHGYFGEDVDECPFLFSTGRGEYGNWFF